MGPVCPPYSFTCTKLLVMESTTGLERSVRVYLGCLCSGAIEHNITEVARGLRPKQAVLDEAVQHFRGDYIAAAGKQGGFVKHSLWPCPWLLVTLKASSADFLCLQDPAQN